MRAALIAVALAACGSPYVTLTVQLHAPAGLGRVSAALAVPPPPEPGGLPDGGFFWFAHDGDSTPARANAHLNWLLEGTFNCKGDIDMAGEDLTLAVGFDAGADVCDVAYLRPNATK